jgi:hypothetical protein
LSLTQALAVLNAVLMSCFTTSLTQRHSIPLSVEQPKHAFYTANSSIRTGDLLL